MASSKPLPFGSPLCGACQTLKDGEKCQCACHKSSLIHCHHVIVRDEGGFTGLKYKKPIQKIRQVITRHTKGEKYETI